jgi:hypothetical protein
MIGVSVEIQIDLFTSVLFDNKTELAKLKVICKEFQSLG